MKTAMVSGSEPKDDSRQRTGRAPPTGVDPEEPLIAWRQAIAAHWPEVRFGTLSVEPRGAERRVTVQVHLGALPPAAVRVELYANAVDDGPPERHTMKRARRLDESGAGYEYCVTIPVARALDDYTPRLLPHHPGASVPLEAPEILWQR